MQSHRRSWFYAAALAGAMLGLAGCAALNQFAADVNTYGDWPAGRSGGSYAFDRLPSQQANAEQAQVLEDAAAPALARAGFSPAAAGAQPDVLVQLGARSGRAERSPWDDPLWWGGGYGGGYGGWRHGPLRGTWTGPYWGGHTLRIESQRYDRDVALLIRDRASGKPLYEARASSEGYQRQVAPVLRPLFAAALTEFPSAGANPRRVMVPLVAE